LQYEKKTFSSFSYSRLDKGGCCHSGYMCGIEYADKCTGTYLGDNSDCTACYPPTGACCRSSGICEVTYQHVCQSPDVWTSGQQCSGNTCGGDVCGNKFCEASENCDNCPSDCGACPSDQCVPTGCCIGSSCSNLTPDDCDAMGGNVQSGLCPPFSACAAPAIQIPVGIGPLKREQ